MLNLNVCNAKQQRKLALNRTMIPVCSMVINGQQVIICTESGTDPDTGVRYGPYFLDAEGWFHSFDELLPKDINIDAEHRLNVVRVGDEVTIYATHSGTATKGIVVFIDRNHPWEDKRGVEIRIVSDTGSMYGYTLPEDGEIERIHSNE